MSKKFGATSTRGYYTAGMTVGTVPDVTSKKPLVGTTNYLVISDVIVASIRRDIWLFSLKCHTFTN